MVDCFRVIPLPQIQSSEIINCLRRIRLKAHGFAKMYLRGLRPVGKYIKTPQVVVSRPRFGILTQRFLPQSFRVGMNGGLAIRQGEERYGESCTEEVEAR